MVENRGAISMVYDMEIRAIDSVLYDDGWMWNDSTVIGVSAFGSDWASDFLLWLSKHSHEDMVRALESKEYKFEEDDQVIEILDGKNDRPILAAVCTNYLQVVT